MKKEDKVETILTNFNGNYPELQISPLCNTISVEDFIPENPDYVDAERYYYISYDKQTGLREGRFDGDQEIEQLIIKRLKEIHGITDPWDNDPDYFKKKIKKKKEELEKEVNNNIRDKQGNYFLLKLNADSKNITNKDYLPDNPKYPDVERYTIYSETEDEAGPQFSDKELEQAVIKRLKEIHGIIDLWDNNPEYFDQRLAQKYLKKALAEDKRQIKLKKEQD